MAMNEMDRNALTPEQRDARLALDVERLLRFGRKHKLIKDLDVLVARNTLLDLLALQAPSDSKPPKENPETPAALLDEMVELASQKDLFDGTVPQYRINFETRLMGALMPRESEVCKKFKKLYERKGAKAATDWFYDLCVVSNYIRTAQIAKNIQWNSASPYGDLEITINLTKPGKGPQNHRPGAAAAQVRLPRLHALQGEHRLCRAHQLPGPPDPPHRTHHAGRPAVLPAVQPLRLLP